MAKTVIEPKSQRDQESHASQATAEPQVSAEHGYDRAQCPESVTQKASRLWFMAKGTGTLTPDEAMLYPQFMAKSSRDVLLVSVSLLLVLGTFSCIRLFMRAQLTHEIPSTAFIVQLLNVVLTLALVTPLLRRNRVAAAWASLYLINTITIFVQIRLLENPGTVLYAVLLLLGLTVLTPFWFNLPLTAITVLFTSGIVLVVFSSVPPGAWLDVTPLFIGVVLGYALIGRMIRRATRDLATATVQMGRSAEHVVYLAQEVDNLRRQAVAIATLEHDIRQPIRSTEGYLQFLEAASGNGPNVSLITAARAANQRASRLICNLLEVARSNIQQSQHKMQNIQGADILASIQTMTPGLARYYDDPPIPVRFAIEGIPPTMILDAEQVQRAILNLLDNALAHTAPGGTITVHSQLDNGDWLIAVEDSGPGIPASIIQALNSSPASAPPVSIGPHFGLGLCQVYATAAHHGGRATIDSTPHGSTVQIRLPVAPEA